MSDILCASKMLSGVGKTILDIKPYTCFTVYPPEKWPSDAHDAVDTCVHISIGWHYTITHLEMYAIYKLKTIITGRIVPTIR